MKWEDITPEKLTWQQAGEVFVLRCVRGGSWRFVAEVLSERWGGDWDSNQIAGMDLCEAAGEKLGCTKEEMNQEPWN